MSHLILLFFVNVPVLDAAVAFALAVAYVVASIVSFFNICFYSSSVANCYLLLHFFPVAVGHFDAAALWSCYYCCCCCFFPLSFDTYALFSLLLHFLRVAAIPTAVCCCLFICFCQIYCCCCFHCQFSSIAFLAISSVCD